MVQDTWHIVSGQEVPHRDGSGPGESWYSSKPTPFGPGMD